MRAAARPKFNAVPQRARLVTDENLIQMSVGLETMMSPGMRLITYALLLGIDFVIIRKNWIDVVRLVAVMTLS